MKSNFQAKLVVVAITLLLLLGHFPASFSLYLTGGEKSLILEAAAYNSRLYGSKSLAWRKGGCYRCWTRRVFIRRSNIDKENFPIRRAMRLSPPPPPVGGRQRAMSVPPAPASAAASASASDSSYH